MKTYFEKVFSWKEFLRFYSKEQLVFIGNPNSEVRSDDTDRFNQISEKCQCDYYGLCYDYEKDSFQTQGVEYSLKAKTLDFLHQFDQDIPLLLNITSMNLRLLGTLLFNIQKIGFKEIYCLYTEPLRYCKITDGEESIDRFDLYKKYKGIEPVPGFLRGNDNKLEEKWIVFLGFSGKRAEQINEKYDFPDVVPIITLPSYKPGWQNYALQENIDLIKAVDRAPDYITANSFLSAYNYLCKLKESNPNTYLRITPIGTKINALGAMLFCLNHKHTVELLYDNPKEEGRISTECGKTFVFDISEVVHEI